MKLGTIDEYLAGVDPEKRRALERLRGQIRSAAPGAEECISYALPAFRQGKVLCGFGATKAHCAFYAFSGTTLELFRGELEGYDVSKGTIRFSPARPLPAALVRRLVRARLAECEPLEKAAKKAPRRSAPSERAPGKDPVARLRAICLALPEADERISHGSPTWFAGKGKVFATLDDHHHGGPHLSVWLPAGPGAQEALIDSDPERFFRPPYVGGKGWVGVVLDTRPDWAMVAWLVEQAYRLVASRHLVATLPSRVED